MHETIKNSEQIQHYLSLPLFQGNVEKDQVSLTNTLHLIKKTYDFPYQSFVVFLRAAGLFPYIMLKQAVYFLLILPDFDGLGTKPNWNKWEPSTIPHTKMAHSGVNRDLARLSVNSYWNIDIGSVVQTSIEPWLSPCHGTVQVLIHVLLIGYICPTKDTHDFLCFLRGCILADFNTGFFYWHQGSELRNQGGFIQHTITLGNITPGLHCKTIIVYWTNMYQTQLKRKNTCWETSSKVITDRLRRGHPGRRGELCGVVDICK